MVILPSKDEQVAARVFLVLLAAIFISAFIPYGLLIVVGILAIALLSFIIWMAVAPVERKKDE